MKKWLLSAVMAVGMNLSLGLVASAKTEATPLNVLQLTVDDMNCDSVGEFGCKVPGTTPNLDKLADESMRFMHTHT